MKKYLFKQTKKAFSLFLAVVMLMSCWVWMAPEEAKVAQAAPGTDKYTVTVKYSTDGGKDLTEGNIKFKTIADGWTNTEDNSGNYQNGVTLTSGSGGLGKNSTHSVSFTTSNFPSCVQIYTKGPEAEGCGDSKVYARVTLTTIDINGITVWKADSKATWQHNNDGWTGAFWVDYSGGDAGTSGGTDVKDLPAGTFTWARPKVAGFVDDTAKSDKNTPITATLGKIGTGSVSSTSTTFDISKYSCVNQYGVKMTYNANRVMELKSETAYISASDNGGKLDTSDITVKDDKTSVTVSPNLQVNKKANENGQAEYYLVKEFAYSKGDGTTLTSRASAKITINYPEYNVVFNAKGNVSDDKFAPVIKVGETGYTNKYEVNGYYGESFNIPADKDVSADGYTFYGFWSVPQPETKKDGDNKQLPYEQQSAGWFYSKKADFATPVSTEVFNERSKFSGAVQSEKYIVVNENGEEEEKYRVVTVDTDGDGVKEKYYDAGTQITDKLFKNDDTVYGWWCSNDYTVKFYDIDGKYIDSFFVKYGQYGEAIEAQNGGELPKSAYLDTGYTSGAFKYAVKPNTWVSTDGETIDLTTHRFTGNLTLTPKLDRTDGSFDNEYSVSFINPDDGKSLTVGLQNGKYTYRQNIAADANEAKGKISKDLAFAGEDLQYSYSFEGWTDVVPSSGKYHILLEDANFNLNGSAISPNGDWIVRNDTTYYAVYRRHTKSYDVKFVYNNTTGQNTEKAVTLKYGDKLVPPADVPYEYNTRGTKYSFANWEFRKNQADDKATIGKNDILTFTSNYIFINSDALSDGDSEPIVINATYGEGVPTPFKVKFSYPDDNGDETSKATDVLVDTSVSADAVNTLAPADEFDDGAAVYTYANSWKIVSGAGTIGLNGDLKEAGAEISTADLTKFVPTSDVEFNAVYANPVYYHNITYVDRDNSYVAKALFGTDIPAWTNKVTNDNGTPDDTSDDYEEDKIYVPKDYKGNSGTYVFQGWFDAKQTDENFKYTNGKPISDYESVPGDVTFYSQFKFVPDTYLIEFMNHDGTEPIRSGKFEYGWNLEGITAEANKAAQNSREDDPKYDYIFIGWDKTVPTFCEGKNMKFIAQYNAVYKYYAAEWYNSKAVIDEDGNITDAAPVESALLATTKHTYESKLYIPSVEEAFTCLKEASDEDSYVFAGWYYDVDDTPTKFERGMKITADMTFYAVYKLTDKTYTVTAVVNDKEPVKYTVAAGEKVDLADPQDGYLNAEKHNEFVAWYTDDSFSTAFDANTPITADITVYAKFIEGNHDFSNEQTKTAPTYYAEGVKEVWCSCDESRKYEESIPMLVDNVKPTGTIYLGSLGQWSSTDEQGAAATDTDDISKITLVANADTNIVITANDTGKKCTPETHTEDDCDACAYDALYNPSGIGKGVKLIRAFVYPGDKPLTATGYGAAQQVAIDVYKNETNDLTNNANFAVKLGDAFVADLDEEGNAQYEADGKTVKTKALESGEVYIVYYYVVDKAGNQLKTKVRTAQFIYDNTAPVFEVEGNSNNAAIPRYCGTATVTGIESGALLTINGKTVEVAENGTYKIDYTDGMDNLVITATDKAGNSYSKKIKVSDHDYYVTKVSSTCYSAGYEEEKCLICKDVKSRKEYPTSGHMMVMSGLVPATCTENGYEIRKCEFCEYAETILYVLDSEGNSTGEYLYPASDHTFDKDGDEIKYTTITESTCTVKGKAQAVCTVCKGELEGGILTKELELDDDNHIDVNIAEVKATCTSDGYYTETCNDCGDVIVNLNASNNSAYEATGHGTEEAGTAAWCVVLEPTCYQNGEEKLQCLKCSHYIDDQVKTIPATGEHILRVVDKKEPTASEEGFILRRCQTPGCTVEKREEFKKLDSFTVTFLKEDGSELKKIIELSTGDKIGAADVTAPKKAADEVNRYSFAGWVEVITNEDGTTKDGAIVKLPLTVTKDMTLKATYRATKIIYTHKFYVPNTWTSTLDTTIGYDEYATLVGAYGDVIKPASEPVFKIADKEADAELKKMYTFKFKGWKDLSGNEVTDFKVTGDTKFYAYFEAIPVKYDVIYYNGTDYVWSTTVDGGEAAVFGGETPEKAYNDTYHYEFDKWYIDAALKTAYNGEEITGKTQLYAGFTAIEHDYADAKDADGNVIIVQQSTCTLPELKKVVCACGHEKTAKNNDATGHKPGTAVEETRDDGIYEVVKCTNKDCGAVLSETKISYTVTFKNASGATLQISVIKKGEDIKYEKEEPTKADSDDKSYKFKGWYVEGDENKTIVTLGKATADVVYIAKYEEIIKTFSLTFVDKDNNPVKITEDLEYKYTIKDSDFPENLADYYTDTDHYTFVGWSAAVGDKLKDDLIVKPVFNVASHDWKEIGNAEKDCEKAGDITYKCSCGATKVEKGVAKAHKWEIVEGSRVEPQGETDGYYNKKCTVCEKTEQVIIPAVKKRDVVFTVKDSNGNAISGAIVTIYQNEERIDGADTNAAGQVSFKLYDGKYKVLVSGVADANNDGYEFKVTSKGYEGEVIMQIIEKGCGCSCHRDGFWGIIFRFFHKIIAFFTGSINCCANPDSRY